MEVILSSLSLVWHLISLFHQSQCLLIKPHLKNITPVVLSLVCVSNAFPLRSNGAAFFVYVKRETGIYQLFKCTFFHFHFIVLVSSTLLQARGEPADHCLGALGWHQVAHHVTLHTDSGMKPS